jgi:MFS family permease
MQLFKNVTFTKMFLATFASQLGTVVGNMAFAFYLLDRFSSQPYYATLAELMYSLPTLVVFLFVGVIADRLDRKQITVNSDWIRAGLSVFLLVALHWNWIIPAFVLLFLRSAVSKFFAPAEMSLLQGVMSSEQYVQAAGLTQTITGLFMLFGMGLGSITYHYLGIEWAVIIDGISFIISGILLMSCHFSPEVRQPNGKIHLRDLKFRSLMADFGEGLLYIKNHQLLRSIIAGFLIFGVVNGVFAVLPIFTMKYKLSPDHYQFYSSLFTLFLGIGYLIGSAFGSTLVKKFSKVTVLITGLFLSGIITIVLNEMENIWVYLTLVGIMGAILAPVNVVLGGWLPELVESKNMGRVSAWIEPLMMFGQSAALGLIAIAFPKMVTLDVLYLLIGILLLVVSIFYWLVLPSLNRKHQAEVGESVALE